jgi:hypothetical protein
MVWYAKYQRRAVPSKRLRQGKAREDGKTGTKKSSETTRSEGDCGQAPMTQFVTELLSQSILC